MITFLDLFAGIGGMRLGMERAGHRCVGACEIDPYCREVYAARFPDTPWWRNDIREIQPAEVPPAHVWTAGFPCQDLSDAGRRKGITGERSGLFFEITRLARVVRPPVLLLENVPGLLARGMGAVCGELAEAGYDARWDIVSAAQCGAHHRRDRVWVVANLRAGPLADAAGD